MSNRYRSLAAENGVRRGLYNGFNPEMLQIAIDLRETYDLELTANAEIEVGRINQFLAYDATPTAEELQRIADILRLPPAFFQRDGLHYPPDFPCCKLSGGSR